MHVVTVKVPEGLLQHVDDLVEDKDLFSTRSEMIREALRDTVRKYKDKEE